MLVAQGGELSLETYSILSSAIRILVRHLTKQTQSREEHALESMPGVDHLIARKRICSLPIANATDEAGSRLILRVTTQLVEVAPSRSCRRARQVHRGLLIE
jgi:hypothetical protein